jgi:hypothetical protein
VCPTKLQPVSLLCPSALCPTYGTLPSRHRVTLFTQGRARTCTCKPHIHCTQHPESMDVQFIIVVCGVRTRLKKGYHLEDTPTSVSKTHTYIQGLITNTHKYDLPTPHQAKQSVHHPLTQYTLLLSLVLAPFLCNFSGTCVTPAPRVALFLWPLNALLLSSINRSEHVMEPYPCEHEPRKYRLPQAMPPVSQSHPSPYHSILLQLPRWYVHTYETSASTRRQTHTKMRPLPPPPPLLQGEGRPVGPRIPG